MLSCITISTDWRSKLSHLEMVERHIISDPNPESQINAYLAYLAIKRAMAVIKAAVLF